MDTPEVAEGSTTQGQAESDKLILEWPVPERRDREKHQSYRQSFVHSGYCCNNILLPRKPDLPEMKHIDEGVSNYSEDEGGEEDEDSQIEKNAADAHQVKYYYF